MLKQILLGEDSCLALKDVRFNGNNVSSPNNRIMADELAAMANSCGGAAYSYWELTASQK